MKVPIGTIFCWNCGSIVAHQHGIRTYICKVCQSASPTEFEQRNRVATQGRVISSSLMLRFEAAVEFASFADRVNRLIASGKLPEKGAFPRLFYPGHRAVHAYVHAAENEDWVCIPCGHRWTGHPKGDQCPVCTEKTDIYEVNIMWTAHWQCVWCRREWDGEDGIHCPYCRRKADPIIPEEEE